MEEKKPAVPEEARKIRKFTFNEQREYERIDAVIADVERKLQDTAEEIDAAGSDFELLQKLVDVQKELERELDALLERWTYLNEMAEEMNKS